MPLPTGDLRQILITCQQYINVEAHGNIIVVIIIFLNNVQKLFELHFVVDKYVFNDIIVSIMTLV